MSLPQTITVNCNNCRVSQDFTTWETLNASLNPEAKDALLKGELTQFVCEKCGTSAEVVYPLLYHDMARQLMIWLVPDDGTPDTGPMPMDEFMQDYQFRVVRNRNQLVEKIRIFENGLDDRVLEFAKFLLRRGASLDGQKIEGELLYHSDGKTPSGEPAIQFVQLAPAGIEQRIMPKSLLDEFVSELGAKLPSSKSESGQWLEVNDHYAAKLAAMF